MLADEKTAALRHDVRSAVVGRDVERAMNMPLPDPMSVLELYNEARGDCLYKCRLCSSEAELESMREHLLTRLVTSVFEFLMLTSPASVFVDILSCWPLRDTSLPRHPRRSVSSPSTRSLRTMNCQHPRRSVLTIRPRHR